LEVVEFYLLNGVIFSSDVIKEEDNVLKEKDCNSKRGKKSSMLSNKFP